MLQHASPTASSAKDAYLVSLSGDANDAGYVVLRRERGEPAATHVELTRAVSRRAQN